MPLFGTPTSRKLASPSVATKACTFPGAMTCPGPPCRADRRQRYNL